MKLLGAFAASWLAVIAVLASTFGGTSAIPLLAGAGLYGLTFGGRAGTAAAAGLAVGYALLSPFPFRASLLLLGTLYGTAVLWRDVLRFTGATPRFILALLCGQAAAAAISFGPALPAALPGLAAAFVLSAATATLLRRRHDAPSHALARPLR